MISYITPNEMLNYAVNNSLFWGDLGRFQVEKNIILQNIKKGRSK